MRPAFRLKSEVSVASSSSTVSGASTIVPTYTVNVDKPYSFIIQGEYGTPTGLLCKATDIETSIDKAGAVKAFSPTGSGITMVKSNTGKEFSGEGLKQVVIDNGTSSKTIYINVVPVPVAGTITVAW